MFNKRNSAFPTNAWLSPASAVLLVLLSACVCVAQPPEAIDLREEDPERRKILQLLFELQDTKPEQVLQSVAMFDAAWEMAVRREDPLLNLKTEVQQSLEPGQSELYAGARARLQQIYESAAPDFRRTYEQQVNHLAQAAFDQAVQSASVNDLIEMILRYQFTSTGQQALQHLIQLRLSRGEFLQAALQYGRLLRLQNDDSHAKRTQLAILWWKAGLPEEAVDYLHDVVQNHAGAEVQIGGRMRTLPAVDSDLQQWLQQAAGVSGDRVPGGDRNGDTGTVVTDAHEWTQPLGNYRRSQTQPRGPAAVQTQWSASTFEVLEQTDLNPLLAAATVNLDDELSSGREMNNTVIPVAKPLAVGDLLIFRTAANLRAVDRQSGAVAWESFFIDRQLQTAREAWRRVEDNDHLNVMELRRNLLNHWTRANSGGQLAFDGRTLFAVEEATSETMQLALDNQLPEQDRANNYLRAYSATSGLLLGQAGGPVGDSGGGLANPLAGMFFLGAPLVMGDRIYVIAESDQGIFLLQLKATSLYPQKDGEVDMRPVRSQLLSIPRHSLSQHPVRKYAGIIPSYGRGLLICNTCDEQVVAISAEDHAVRWIYRYPSNVTVAELGRDLAVIGHAFSQQESDRLDLTSRWTDSLPRIVGDRVLLTPRDADRLFCLNLLTGQELWSRPRGAFRTIVAVTDDHVVLTGNSVVECLNLSDGKSVWSNRIAEGYVSGTAISTGQVLQVPTSQPAIVTYDLQTGRLLAVQPLTETPGNLLSSQGQLYSQSVTSVQALGLDSEAEATPLITATDQLLSGDLKAAEDTLRQVIATADSAQQYQARTMLIRILMETVRADYVANAELVPELKALIEAHAPAETQLLDTVQGLLGMTPVDAAMLPLQWKQINYRRQHLTELRDIVSQGQLQNLNEVPEVLAQRIVEMLDEAFAARDTWSTSAALLQRSSRLPIASIRNAIQLRDADITATLTDLVVTALVQRMQHAESAEDTQAWAEISLLAGFAQAVTQATETSDVDFPKDTARAIQHLALAMVADSENSAAATQAAERLLNTDESGLQPLLAAELLLRSTGFSSTEAIAGSVAPGILRYGVLPTAQMDSQQMSQRLDQLQSEQPAAPFAGTPTVTESDARSVTAASTFEDSGAIQTDVPLYGTPGVFGGWTFVKQRPEKWTIQAFDAAGRLRWAFDPGPQMQRRNTSFAGPRLMQEYLVACGSLLAIKLDNNLWVLDCSTATSSQAPQLLWHQDLTPVLTRLSGIQNFQPAWTRTSQYDLRPSGLFPVGPFTPHGIPVYSGRRIMLLNAFNGQVEWSAQGLPEDCTLTATDQHLLLISESTGQVEVRSLIDGSVQKVVALAEWWNDATENSNASVQMFELEPGEDLRFRLAVQHGGVILQRRNLQASALERHSLLTNETDWSIPLPADSLVSNINNSHVAVLSDGNRLQLYNIVSGTKVADLAVPPAPDGMYLYLRFSGGQWLVITDVFDQDHEEQNPIGEGVIVSGQVYAIDQQTGAFTWSTPIQHEWMRILRPSPSQAPMPPIAPFLTLLKRPFPPPGPNGVRRGPIVYQVKVLDARTGKLLYQDDDVGQGLSYHWMRVNPEKNRIDLSFDKRVVTFTYPTAAE